MLTADVAAMWDTSVYNAGFIVVKPTNVSKRLYRMTRMISNKSANLFDQVAINIAAKVLKNEDAGLKLKTLNTQRFLAGKDYFEKQRRFFAPTERQICDQQKQTNCAVVVHNNWIVTKAAKVYRFREHLMWMYDGDDEYYSSKNRRYLMYNDQPHTKSGNRQFTAQQIVKSNSEIYELKTAMTIGHLLNRTVILPLFHSKETTSMVPLHYILHLQSFDAHFGGKYRENSFLRHPKVPLDVKSGLATNLQQHTINTSYNAKLSGINIIVLAVDIVRQFGDMNDRLLKLDSLYGITVSLGNSSEDSAFKQKLYQAFYRSHHRQFRPAGRL